MTFENEPAMVRVRLSLPSVQQLLAECARSDGREALELRSAEPLEPGSSVVVEASAPWLLAPMELLARVEGEAARSGEGYACPARYAGERVESTAFRSSLQWAFEEHHWGRLRRHPRIPMNFAAVDPGREGRVYFVRDLSAGGLSVVLPGPVQSLARRGDRLVLDLELEPLIGLELESVLVWTVDAVAEGEEARFGASFEELSEGQRVLIHDLIHRRRPLKAIARLVRRSGG